MISSIYLCWHLYFHADSCVSMFLPLWDGLSTTILTDAWRAEQKYQNQHVNKTAKQEFLHILLIIWGTKFKSSVFIVEYTCEQNSLTEHEFYQDWIQGRLWLIVAMLNSEHAWSCSELYSQPHFQYLGYLYSAWGESLRMVHIIQAEKQKRSMQEEIPSRNGHIKFCIPFKLQASGSYLSLFRFINMNSLLIFCI